MITLADDEGTFDLNDLPTDTIVMKQVKKLARLAKEGRLTFICSFGGTSIGEQYTMFGIPQGTLVEDVDAAMVNMFACYQEAQKGHISTASLN